MGFRDRIMQLRPEDMNDIERSISELRCQGDFPAEFPSVITTCIATCVSFMNSLIESDKEGIEVSTEFLDFNNSTEIMAKINIRASNSLPFIPQNQSASTTGQNDSNRDLEAAKTVLIKHLEAIKLPSNQKQEILRNNSEEDLSRDYQGGIIALSNILRYSISPSKTPYGTYSWNLCFKDKLYELKLELAPVVRKQVTPKFPNSRTVINITPINTTPTNIRIESEPSQDSFQQESSGTSSPGFAIVLKAVLTVSIVFALTFSFLLFGSSSCPTLSTGVKDRTIIVAELKARSSGGKSVDNRQIRKMSTEDLLKSLKQAREDEQKMSAFFAPEPEKLETPKELEKGIESVFSEIISATNKEFESILETSTISDLKKYLETTEELIKSLKGGADE